MIQNNNYVYQWEPQLDINNPEHKECLEKPNSVLKQLNNYQYNREFEENQMRIIQEVMIKGYNYYESKEQIEHKKQVLEKLSIIVREWSNQVGRKEGLPEQQVGKIQGKLFTFGSYYLNVDYSDGDIDMVCVVPRLINKEEHFFNDLYDLLKANSKTTFIQKVTGAKVPILKLEFDSIKVDICFAKVDVETLDDNLDLESNNILINMDETSCKSINGRRVADRILKAVPDQEKFRQTLRIIKLWAKNQSIYSNVMGYLGGISWAIMTAKICQLFPSFSAYRLTKMFFWCYSEWEWNKVAIKLYEIEDEPDNPINKDNWQGKAEDFKNGKIFVITPSFPCMNSSHNITESSFIVLKDLIQTTYQKYFQIQEHTFNATHSYNQQYYFWHSFFAKIDFFNIYPNFIQIDILYKNNDHFQFEQWKGHVERKLRLLTLYFKDSTDLFYFHLLPHSFNNYHNDFAFSQTYFYGIKLQKNCIINKAKQYDFKKPIQQFIYNLVENKQSFKWNKETQNLRVFQIKKHQFKIEKNTFIKQVNQQESIQDQDQVNKKVKLNDNEEQEKIKEIKVEQIINIQKKLSNFSDDGFLDRYKDCD